MARRRIEGEGSILEFCFALVSLYFLWIVLLYATNRAAFWRQVWYFLIITAAGIASVYSWKKFRLRSQEKKLRCLINELRKNGLEQYVINFITRFGLPNAKKTGWSYRGHYFDWDRLTDFRKVLNEKGMRIPYDSWSEISALLRNYIQ